MNEKYLDNAEEEYEARCTKNRQIQCELEDMQLQHEQLKEQMRELREYIAAKRTVGVASMIEDSDFRSLIPEEGASVISIEVSSSDDDGGL